MSNFEPLQILSYLSGNTQNTYILLVFGSPTVCTNVISIRQVALAKSELMRQNWFFGDLE